MQKVYAYQKKGQENFSLTENAELLAQIALSYLAINDHEGIIDALEELERITKSRKGRSVHIRLLLQKTADRTGYKILALSHNNG